MPAAPPASGSAVLEFIRHGHAAGRQGGKEIRGLFGRLVRQLERMFEGKLAVRTVSAKGRVTVTYAWGTLADNKPGTVDGQGKIGGSALKLDRFANGADATFTMQGDGTLAGTYALSGTTYTGVFSRR